MTLTGLGTPLMPECPLETRTSLLVPPSTLVIRPQPHRTGRVPACFFNLLHQVPQAVPVPCLNPSAIIPPSPNRKSSNEVTLTTEEDDQHHQIHRDAIDPELEQCLLQNRQLLESRIKSLRLEFGDLSISENLEKLCDHYFKLDKNKQRSEEFNRKLSMLLNEKTCTKENACHEKACVQNSYEMSDQASQSLDVNHDMGHGVVGHSSKTGPCVTFNLNETNMQAESETRKDSSVSATSCTSIPSSGFGNIFHGILSRKETEALLQNEGEYLIRIIFGEGSFILSFRCNGNIQNFRITKDSESEDLFYLEDQKTVYASLDEMVSEGLRTLFLDLRAGAYVDALTELAQINKHDSMISWLSPNGSSNATTPGSRKNSAVSIYVGVVGPRRPSFNPQCSSNGGSELATPDETDEMENPLVQHFFLPGTLNLDKKTPCDLEGCPLRQKYSRGANLPSGKETFVCRDCGLTIHGKCVDRLQSSKLLSCVPDLYKIPEIFGADLTTILKATMAVDDQTNDDQSQKKNRESKPKPPFVVTKCVQEIERRGLGSEGIYRIPGSQDVVLKMQNLLERERTNADLTIFPDTDSICGLLKLYLRVLPEPLITRPVFSRFMQDANDNIPLTLDNTKRNLESLPPAHKITLRYLLAHLDRIVKEKEMNKMSAYNLSVVLVPSIIVPDEMTLVTLKIATDVLDMLLRNNSTFGFFSV